MQDTLSHPDLTQDMGIAAVRLAAQNGNQELAINTLQTLKQKLKFSSDKYKLQELHLVSPLGFNPYLNLSTFL